MKKIIVLAIIFLILHFMHGCTNVHNISLADYNIVQIDIDGDDPVEQVVMIFLASVKEEKAIILVYRQYTGEYLGVVIAKRSGSFFYPLNGQPYKLEELEKEEVPEGVIELKRVDKP